MPPKKSSASQVWIVLDGTSVDSVHATSVAASQRLVALGSDEADIVKKDLSGGTITISAAEEQKEAPKTKPAKATKPAAEANGNGDAAAAPKTKSVAEQRAANASKKAGKTDSEDLPDNVKALLAGSGDAFDGMTIVVTGIPPTLGRKNAETLVTNFGGHLTKSLSKKTSYVVVGNDAGPTKLDKIAELGIKTLDEDAFIALLEGGGAGGVKRAADDDEDEEEEKPAKAKKQKK